MRILYIDTSSSYLYTAIAENDNLLIEVKKEFGQSLSEEALPEIATMFEKTELEAKDIDKIIVVNGPGSFTGIRIGITIAKVYAWTLNIPIISISALEVMALSSDEDKYHIPVIDARRKYVFAAIYDTNYQQILHPQHIKIEELNQKIASLIEENYEIITNNEIDEFPTYKKYNPNILKTINYFKDQAGINPHSVNPEYLKLTEAEESKKND